LFHDDRREEDLEEKEDDHAQGKGVEYECEEVKEFHLS
jgi:hypothetical protein